MSDTRRVVPEASVYMTRRSGIKGNDSENDNDGKNPLTKETYDGGDVWEFS